ncbi:MAG: hypothetical protein ACREBJ_00055 [Nitrosotalea sp.]
MSGTSPESILYDSDGNLLAVQNATAIPASTPLLMIGGSDGTNSRYITVDSSGCQIMVGAGVAGTPAGGVISIQGIAGGTVIPVSVTGTATISGTVTANQGTANTLSHKWPVQVTDGTNVMPTADVASRAQFNKITDGTHTAAVKAASTPPLETDQALVVVISPNQTNIPVTTSPYPTYSGIALGYVTTSATTKVAVQATTYTQQSANFTGSIKSSSANDTSSGTGANSITINYVDETGTISDTEVATLNGTTAVNLVSTDKCFIESIQVTTVGSDGYNDGIISLFTGAGGAGTTVASIAAGDNRTYLGHHYMVEGITSNIIGMTGFNNGSNSSIFTIYAQAIPVANQVNLQISDWINIYETSQLVRVYNQFIKVHGPAVIQIYCSPMSASTIKNYASFDYYDE